MNILQLMVQLGIKGADKVDSALEGVEESAHGAAKGIKESGSAAREAEGEFEHFKFGALEAVFAMESLTSGMKETIAVAGELSGMKAATEWAHLADGLAAVTDNAEAARDMLKEVKEMAQGTIYNAQDFARIAPELVNAGVPEGRVVDQLQDMANLAAKGGLGRDQLPEFLESMVRLKDMDHPMVKQLMGMDSLPIAKLVNAGAGTHFANTNQANDFLASTGRGQGYDILLKGADALGKDAAALQKANDPAMAFAKTLETLEEVMEPTGELLLKVLGPVGDKLGWLAEQLEHVNAITGGSAGLIGIIILLLRHHKLLISSFRAAIRFTRDLTEAVERYGAAAEVGAKAAEHAAIATRIAAEADEQKGSVDLMSAILALPKHNTETPMAKIMREGQEMAAHGGLKSVEEAAEASRHVGLITKLLKPLASLKSLLSLAKLAKIADIATFAAGLGLETLGDHMRGADGQQTRAGSITQGVGEGIGFGGLGFFLGPWVGLATTLTGAIAGGVIGNNRFNHQGKAEEHDKALKDNTDALVELKGTVVGGGARTRAAFSQMQLERGVAKAMAGMA